MSYLIRPHACDRHIVDVDVTCASVDQIARAGGRRALDRQHIACGARGREVSNTLGGRAEADGRRTCGAVGVGDVGEEIVVAVTVRVALRRLGLQRNA
jgi:hypothetical protein